MPNTPIKSPGVCIIYMYVCMREGGREGERERERERERKRERERVNVCVTIIKN
jgi:hypothetical protein